MNDPEGLVNGRTLEGTQVQPLIRAGQRAATLGLPGLRELWLEVKRLRVHCLQLGNRDHPVLILHGGGLDAAGLSFRTTIPVLAEQHCVFAPDWPGFGRSDPMPMAWRVEECVDFVGEILDALDLKRVSLIGVSMGGAFALGFTLRAPERIDRLVLVDSAGMGNDIPGGLLSFLTMRLPLLDELRWTLLVGNRTLARRILCAALINCNQVLNEEMLDEIILLARQAGGPTVSSDIHSVPSGRSGGFRAPRDTPGERIHKSTLAAPRC